MGLIKAEDKCRLKDLWIARMTESMELIHPELSHSEIEAMVTKIYERKFIDHEAQLYNSYENTVAPVTLATMVNWFKKANPLIVESGVYFYQKDVKINLNVAIIKETMLDARSIHKKEKFKAKEAGDTFLEAVKDSQQLNDKKAANSGYGAEGESSSFLYNQHSAMSVTAAGRGQLSTACQCFENLLADSVKFFNMNEFFTFVYNIIHEKDEWKFNTFEYLDVPTEDEFCDRFFNKFGSPIFVNEDMIRSVYNNLDDEMKARVYYKANLRAFLVRAKIRKLYTQILDEDADFKNPNEIPEEIKDYCNKITDLVTEFVTYKYGVFRYEDRTKYQRREVTIVMDTDSTFYYLGLLKNFVITTVLPVKIWRKKDKEVKDRFNNTILNVLCNFANAAIKDTLWHYLSKVNVPEVDRPYVNMKNEYYYPIIITTWARKSYFGSLKRQESHIFKTPKIDVKGVNFFKSTAAKETSKFIYDTILRDELFNSKTGTPNLMSVYKAIYNFQCEIRDKIQNGDMGFLKGSVKVKTPDAYVNPMRIGQYKAVYVWNSVCEDSELISLPASVTLVKVKLRNKTDVAVLEGYPKIYKKLMNLFENNPDIGDFEENGKIVKGKGIKTIAIPEELEEVPEWILKVIDTDTIVADNMALFTQINNSLGLVPGTSAGSNTKYYTNVVRI